MMIRLLPNRDRLANLAESNKLDPATDYWQIHRLTVQDFQFEMNLGHRTAFFRTYASPTIAELLAHTGHLLHDTYKRGLDTALFIFEFIECGLDAPRSRALLRRLNGMHHRYRISNDDYLYVLSTFAVIPLRLITLHGWRQLSPAEVDATHRFYADLGRRMGIRNIPDSYPTMAQFLDEYEATRFAHTPSGEALMNAITGVITDRKSRLTRPMARWTISYLLDDRTRSALAVAAPPAPGRLMVEAYLRSQAAVQRRQSPPASWFTSGGPQDIYPDGYSVNDLGPTEKPAAPLTSSSTRDQLLRRW